MLLHNFTKTMLTEANQRLSVVGEQFTVEMKVANSESGRAVFLVPTLLTPLFIAPEAVQYNKETKLFVLKPGYENAIPAGLIPREKQADPRQLSTVLARVRSIHCLLESGVPLTILYTQDNRSRVDAPDKYVDDSYIGILKKTYPTQLVLNKISVDIYNQYKEKVCAASYEYEDEKGKPQQVGIDATQVNMANVPQPFGVHIANFAQEKLLALQELLEKVNMFTNLIVIESTQQDEIVSRLKALDIKGAHFTNGTFALPAKMAVPTTLAGFKYVLERQPDLPLVVAVNSDESMRRIGKTDFEPQMIRAMKGVKPLAEVFSDNKVIVLFYDEETPHNLYKCLQTYGHTQTLHKWGYGTEPAAPKIEGAELFQAVYAYPLPNDKKPVCWEETPLADKPQEIQVIELSSRLIAADGVLFKLPKNLEQYQSSALLEEQHKSPLRMRR